MVLRGDQGFFSFGRSVREERFREELGEFDALFAAWLGDKEGGAREKEEFLPLLRELEKRARGVEGRLSVLKRQRLLALEDSGYIAAFEKSARGAASDFPYSEALAVVAAEAQILQGTPLEGDRKIRFMDYGKRISPDRFASVVFPIYVLSKSLENPGQALSIPKGGELITTFLSQYPSVETLEEEERAGLAINGAILKILEGDGAEAGARITGMLRDGTLGKNPSVLSFAAEFFYDFGNPLRAAEIFSGFTDDYNLSRAASAFWVAGESSGARNIWIILAGRQGSTGNPGFHSLYNLSAAADTMDEKKAWLERLLAEQVRYGIPDDSPEAIYSLIRYTRLLDVSQALNMLREKLEPGSLPRPSPPESGENPPLELIDLELQRRRFESMPVDRSIAETWFLMGRHPGNENIYRWGCYYFDHQRQYGETVRLLKNAAHQGIKGDWMVLHTSLVLLQDGQLTEGEALLREASGNSTLWQLNANLGRLMESQRSIAQALEYYETAVSQVKDRKTAAQLQLRISRCLLTLNRPRESRRALERALEYDGENLNARHELYRLDIQGIF